MSNICSADQVSAVRWGDVETRVVENFLSCPDELEKACRIVEKDLRSGGFVVKNQLQGVDRWCSSSDIIFNLQKLMANAGFYFDLEADFFNRYHHGARNTYPQ